MKGDNLEKLIESKGHKISFTLSKSKNEINIRCFHTKLFLHLQKKIIGHIQLIIEAQERIEKELTRIRQHGR